MHASPSVLEALNRERERLRRELAQIRSGEPVVADRPSKAFAQSAPSIVASTTAARQATMRPSTRAFETPSLSKPSQESGMDKLRLELQGLEQLEERPTFAKQTLGRLSLAELSSPARDFAQPSGDAPPSSDNRLFPADRDILPASQPSPSSRSMTLNALSQSPFIETNTLALENLRQTILSLPEGFPAALPSTQPPAFGQPLSFSGGPNFQLAQDPSPTATLGRTTIPLSPVPASPGSANRGLMSAKSKIAELDQTIHQLISNGRSNLTDEQAFYLSLLEKEKLKLELADFEERERTIRQRLATATAGVVAAAADPSPSQAEGYVMLPKDEAKAVLSAIRQISPKKSRKSSAAHQLATPTSASAPPPPPIIRLPTSTVKTLELFEQRLSSQLQLEIQPEMEPETEEELLPAESTTPTMPPAAAAPIAVLSEAEKKKIAEEVRAEVERSMRIEAEKQAHRLELEKREKEREEALAREQERKREERKAALDMAQMRADEEAKLKELQAKREGEEERLRQLHSKRLAEEEEERQRAEERARAEREAELRRSQLELEETVRKQKEATAMLSRELEEMRQRARGEEEVALRRRVSELEKIEARKSAQQMDSFASRDPSPSRGPLSHSFVSPFATPRAAFGKQLAEEEALLQALQARREAEEERLYHLQQQRLIEEEERKKMEAELNLQKFALRESEEKARADREAELRAMQIEMQESVRQQKEAAESLARQLEELKVAKSREEEERKQQQEKPQPPEPTPPALSPQDIENLKAKLLKEAEDAIREQILAHVKQNIPPPPPPQPQPTEIPTESSSSGSQPQVSASLEYIQKLEKEREEMWEEISRLKSMALSAKGGGSDSGEANWLASEGSSTPSAPPMTFSGTRTFSASKLRPSERSQQTAPPPPAADSINFDASDQISVFNPSTRNSFSTPQVISVSGEDHQQEFSYRVDPITTVPLVTSQSAGGVFIDTREGTLSTPRQELEDTKRGSISSLPSTPSSSRSQSKPSKQQPVPVVTVELFSTPIDSAPQTPSSQKRTTPPPPPLPPLVQPQVTATPEALLSRKNSQQLSESNSLPFVSQPMLLPTEQSLNTRDSPPLPPVVAIGTTSLQDQQLSAPPTRPRVPELKLPELQIDVQPKAVDTDAQPTTPTTVSSNAQPPVQPPPAIAVDQDHHHIDLDSEEESHSSVEGTDQGHNQEDKHVAPPPTPTTPSNNALSDIQKPPKRDEEALKLKIEAVKQRMIRCDEAVRKGDVLVKYGRQGKPQLRFMWVRGPPDDAELCWATKRGAKESDTVRLGQVLDSVLGTASPVFQRHKLSNGLFRGVSSNHSGATCFTLTLPDRTVDLMASSAEQMDVWVMGISLHVPAYRQRLLQQVGGNLSPSSSTPVASPPSSPTASSATRSVSFSSGSSQPLTPTTPDSAAAAGNRETQKSPRTTTPPTETPSGDKKTPSSSDQSDNDSASGSKSKASGGDVVLTEDDIRRLFNADEFYSYMNGSTEVMQYLAQLDETNKQKYLLYLQKKYLQHKKSEEIRNQQDQESSQGFGSEQPSEQYYVDPHVELKNNLRQKLASN